MENTIIPNSIEAENIILGSILQDNNNIEKIITILPNKLYFYNIENQYIYNIVLELYGLNLPVDHNIIIEKLKNYKLETNIINIDYLEKLKKITVDEKKILFFCNIIKEKYILRNILETSKRTIKEIIEKNETSENIINELEQKISEVSHDNTNNLFFSPSELLQETKQKIKDYCEKKENINSIKSGFSKLDEITAGFHGGNLIIIAGRPAMGKTSFCLNIAENIAKSNKSVGIFSLEMSKEELNYKLLCTMANVSSHTVRMGHATKQDLEKIEKASENFKKLPIYIDDTATISIFEMRTKSKKLKKEKGLDILIIDYLQLMKGKTGRAEYRTQDITEMTRSLKILARELNIPIIALSQLNRATETRENKRPVLSDLRESGSIEQDADLVGFIYREGYYKKDDLNLKTDAEIIIAKQRHGSTGVIKLNFEERITKFSDSIYF